MGWLIGWSSRKGLIQHLTKDNSGRCYNEHVHPKGMDPDDFDRYRYESKTLKSCYRGGIRAGSLWAVKEYTEFKDDVLIKQDKYIILFMLRYYGEKHGGWGYKDVEESCGPIYYSCPVSYFELVPEPPNEWAREWREEVLKQKQRLYSPSVGEPVLLHNGVSFHDTGEVVSEVTISRLKPLLGYTPRGRLVKIKKAWIKGRKPLESQTPVEQIQK